jgi:DNA (cytosine-5)-methyltransferase 1
MNVLDLFSGIGGFSLGLERAGMRTVAFCERDEYCRAVLRKHWPNVPCFDDIRAIDADGLDRLGRIDLVCGGFPCQPFSVAGKQRAQEDDRHLWPEMRRVIALARPAWVIGENVTGLISLALDDVLADLEAIGYTARSFVIPAVAVGAPHRRDRLWIIATHADRFGLRGSGREQDVRAASEISSEAQQQRLRVDPRSTCKAVADTDCLAGNEGRESDRPQEPRGWNADRSREHADVSDPEHRGCEGRNTQRDGASPTMPSGWWSAEPAVGRVAHGVPRRVDRLRCLGNAVVPPIVEEIGRAILKSI